MADRPRTMRCAIYTRKSTEEGLDQDFNSLDAQREAVEAYVHSRRQEGWTALPQRYDDGGFTGANLDRPGLKQLLCDIEAHSIDCVLVYKVDRLSRSLLDFARLVEVFDRHGVCFVSITQDFNTSTCIGRLTLHILLSFAQFEREIISERTRDKLSAARRKGKWTGGVPTLGYDVAPSGGRLIINEREAEQVREIFALYDQLGTLQATLDAIAARGITTKIWNSKRGKFHTGRSFSKRSLRHLLSNVVYLGEMSYKGTIYPGEHLSILDRELWTAVNQRLHRQSAHLREKAHQQNALFSTVLVCARCQSAMIPTFAVKAGVRQSYYNCKQCRSNNESWCRQKSIAALELETVVGERLGAITGERISRPIVERLVQRIVYDGISRGVTIELRDGSSVTCPLAALPGNEPSRRTPRISRLLALASKLNTLVGTEGVRTYSELAHIGHVSRPRLSQIMMLLNLAPDIQEELLFLPTVTSGRDLITEKALRQVARTIDWNGQRRTFHSLMKATQNRI